MRLIFSVGLVMSLMISSVISGCGFALRGTAIPLPARYSKTYFESESIKGVSNSLPKQVKELLVLGGGQLVPRKDASVSIHLSDIDSQSRQIVLAGNGTTKEYERTYRVTVTVVDLKSGVQLGSRTLSSTHNIQLNDTHVLAGQDEARTVQKSAEQSLAHQILRYLKTL